MKRNIFLLFAGLLFLLVLNSGCNLINPPEEHAGSDDLMTIGVKQVFHNDKYNFALKLDSVSEDSRCPNGAECFWEGNAKVKLDLIVEGNYHHQFYLNTSGIFQRDTTIRGINYKLTEVLPHPDIHTKYSYDAYRAKILATKQ
jgi:hypothetical protein